MDGKSWPTCQIEAGLMHAGSSPRLHWSSVRLKIPPLELIRQPKSLDPNKCLMSGSRNTTKLHSDSVSQRWSRPAPWHAEYGTVANPLISYSLFDVLPLDTVGLHFRSPSSILCRGSLIAHLCVHGTYIDSL